MFFLQPFPSVFHSHDLSGIQTKALHQIALFIEYIIRSGERVKRQVIVAIFLLLKSDGTL